MIIYNVTIKVSWRIQEDWLQWMREQHMPAVIATGCFRQYQLVRMLGVDEEEGPTYAVQYLADDIGQYEHYMEQYAAGLREESVKKWGDQFIAFRSVMEIVN